MSRKVILSVILIVSLFVQTFVFAGGSENIDLNDPLRVGLKQYYEEQPSIHIENNSLLMGYYTENVWTQEVELTSSNGFTVEPAVGYFLVSNEFFYTYEDILPIIDSLREEGYDAFAGNASPGIWKIYAGNEGSYDSIVSLQNTICDIEDLTFEIVEDTGYRTMLSYGDRYPIILENTFGHPSFTTKELNKGVPVIDLGYRSYRGYMEIGRYSKAGVTAINIINLNEYLYGVLPSEMAYTWPLEALKAQAVAARNFAIYYGILHKKYSYEAYDICDTVYSQVYKGFTIEAESCNQAVRQTSERLIYYGDTVIPAYFFSTSGGKTENSENVWSGTVPYLKSVPDLFETDPEKKPWVQTLTASEIKDALNNKGVYIGNIVDVEVTNYSDAGRAMGLKIIGSTGQEVLSKETMRYWLGLYSRKFDLVKENYTPVDIYATTGIDHSQSIQFNDQYVIHGSGEIDSMQLSEQVIIMSEDNIENYPIIHGENEKYIFVGQGYGHGVGMSQSGAKGMALAGYTYDEILEHYYSGTVVR